MKLIYTQSHKLNQDRVYVISETAQHLTGTCNYKTKPNYNQAQLTTQKPEQQTNTQIRLNKTKTWLSSLLHHLSRKEWVYSAATEPADRCIPRSLLAL